LKQLGRKSERGGISLLGFADDSFNIAFLGQAPQADFSDLSALMKTAMINPDGKNKRIFRIMILVSLAALGFAIWLMVHATMKLK